MMEPDNEAPEQDLEPGGSEDVGFAGDLLWLGRGFFQPLYNLQFYRAAANRSIVDAVVFFIAFGVLMTLVSTFNVSRTLRSVSEDIEQAFASGQFPEIVIQNGLAIVRARQPLILLEEPGSIIIIDTTGTYRSIDTGQYAQGFLLTQDSLHAYSSGDYQIIQLRDLQQMLGNPIVINQATALDFWSSFTSTFSLLAFISLAIWNLLIRFLSLALLAVIVMPVLSALNARSDYSSVLTIGIYAAVPAAYIAFVLGQVGVAFCGFQTGLLVTIWLVVGRLALKPAEPPAPLTQAA